MVVMLLRASLSVHILTNLDIHARGANRTGLLIQVRDHAGIVLANRSRHLVEVIALVGPSGRRLDLE